MQLLEVLCMQDFSVVWINEGFKNEGIFLDIFLFLKKEMNMEHTPSEHESFNDDICYTDDDSSVSESEE